jgi:hypothetical protein
MIVRHIVATSAFALFALAGISAGASQARAADLMSLSQPNFNSETLGLNYTGFAQFDVGTSPASGQTSGGSVDVIGNGSFLNYPGDGTNKYVDMCGTTNVCGSLTTKNGFAAGTYNVSVTLGGIIYPLGNGYGAGNDGVAVTFGNSTVDWSVGAVQPAETFTEQVTVTEGTKLVISDLNLTGAGGGAYQDIGASLLGISVSPVPLPGGLSLFGAGLVGLGLVAWKNKKKAV